MPRALLLAAIAAAVTAALGACGGLPERGPAWPKLHEREVDGGESLEPRQASAVAAIEDSDDEPASGPAADEAGGAAAPAAASKADKPAAEAPATREPELIPPEELIIEIED